jgi:hypothetical protein
MDPDLDQDLDVEVEVEVFVTVSGGRCPALRWEAWVGLGEGVGLVDLDQDLDVDVDVSGGRCPFLPCAALSCAVRPGSLSEKGFVGWIWIWMRK